MRVPLGWLAEWIDLPPVATLAERLTMTGLEVDAVERSGPDLAAFVVGHVREREPHPDADKLSLCRVDLGEDEPVEIVCGAPNVAAGQKVAVVRPGSKLPDGTKIKKSKIRGVKSFGMICSASEMGLSDEHEGILVLPDSAVPGTPVAEHVAAGETVLELAILANRGDCASMLGVGREVRALHGGELRMPPTAPAETGPPAAEAVQVAIDDPEGCHHYVARVVRGVSIGPSPEWLQARLEAAGLRPINAVVDVTNLVLLELGQPLHAFDLRKLRGGVVRVRAAAAGEKLATLDGVDRELGEDDLVIADAEGAIALAGVMGGKHSEVDDDTVDLLIESAHFRPSRVRHSARRQGLNTDASFRFERGVDPEGIVRAADRAARLIAELAGGEVAAGVVEARGSEAPRCRAVALSAEHVNRVLGTAIDEAEIVSSLERLGIACEPEGAGRWRCVPPSHRNDIAIAEDLIEEVARIHGFEHVPRSAQEAELHEGHKPPEWDPGETAKDLLKAEGLVEVMTLPFMAQSDLDLLGLSADDPRRETVTIVNPLVEAENRMRPTLVGPLLRHVAANLKRQLGRVGLFEVARVFREPTPGELPEERTHIVAVLTDDAQPGLWAPAEVPLFFVAKAIALRLLDELGYEAGIAPEAPEPYLHPGVSAGLRVGKEPCGAVGELHPEVAARLELERPCAVVELDLTALLALPRRVVRFREVSRHPSAARDLAVVLDRQQRAGDVLEAIRRQGGALLQTVELFDRYEGPGIPEGKVSLAFRLTYQHGDRTLTDAEVNKATDRVVQMLAHRFGGELR